MGNNVNQSTIPTFTRETSIISIMKNDTILFCEDFDGGNRRNFIVVDRDGLASAGGNHSVLTAYTNGWIADFPQENNASRNYYKWTIPGSDINTFGNYCLYQDVLNDTSKFVVYENGLPFGDWNLMQRRQVRGSSAYASHIEWNNGWNGLATYEVHYWEDINENNSFGLGLIRTGGMPPRNVGVPMSISDQSGNRYYLDDVKVIDKYHAESTYKDFNGVEADKIIDKTYADRVYVRQFNYGANLGTVPEPCVIEGWTADRNGRGARLTNYAGGKDYESSQRYKGASILVSEAIENRISINQYGPGVYKYRIRFADNTYSNWIEDVLDIRKLNLWSTDITMSSKNYSGFVYFSKIK